MSKDTNKKEKNSKKEQKSNFMKDLNVELKKVTWPTRKELVTSTATVLFITLIIAVIVFVLDFTFEKMNTYGVEKLKSVVSASENANEVPETVENTDDGNTDSVVENTNETETETDTNTEANTDDTSTDAQPEQNEETENAVQ